jgi:hypothetical protein
MTSDARFEFFPSDFFPPDFRGPPSEDGAPSFIERCNMTAHNWHAQILRGGGSAALPLTKQAMSCANDDELSTMTNLLTGELQRRRYSLRYHNGGFLGTLLLVTNPDIDFATAED